MKCGYCDNQLLWIGDHEDSDERFFSHYECHNCDLEIFFYWNSSEENE